MSSMIRCFIVGLRSAKEPGNIVGLRSGKEPRNATFTSRKATLRRLCFIASSLLWVACVSSVLTADDDLRTLRAKAIRTAAQKVAPSIVRVEKFGVAEGGGEVADDAPTVAVAVDEARHFLASSLVQRQTPTSLVLVTEDGQRSTAKIIATDHRRQLVLLESTDDLGVKPIELADVSSELGQTVVAVGRIAGDGSIAISSGILSAKDRLWGIALQTDARVSSVFYGGPLVDLRGELLGLLVPAVPDDMGEDVTAWYDSGVAFAIPAAAIMSRLPRLIQGDDVRGGLMGIVAKSNDPYVESTEIATVLPRSPAAGADVQAGDMVRSIDGRAVRSHREIKQILGDKDAGQSISIELARKDELLTKQITLTDKIPPLRPQWIGITGQDQKADKEGDSDRVLITGVFDDSPAAKFLKPGDLFKTIDGSPVTDVESLRRRIFSADPSRMLEVEVVRKDDADKQVDVRASIQTAELAISLTPSLPLSLVYADEVSTPWTVTELTLPDLGNKSFVAGPKIKDDQAATTPPLGLLLLLADPGEADLKKLLTNWIEVASKAGVVVCITGPSKDDRWQPEEIDAAGRVMSALTKRYRIDGTMTVISSVGPGAGGSMAMAVGIGRAGTFSGLSVNPDVTPPAIRLRENDPSAPLQLFLRGATSPDEPSWAAALEKTGYAVLRGDDKPETLLQWVRSLPRI